MSLYSLTSLQVGSQFPGMSLSGYRVYRPFLGFSDTLPAGVPDPDYIGSVVFNVSFGSTCCYIRLELDGLGYSVIHNASTHRYKWQSTFPYSHVREVLLYLAICSQE